MILISILLYIGSGKLLLALASTVILGSGSSGTHGHILLYHYSRTLASWLSRLNVYCASSSLFNWCWSSPAQSFLVSGHVGTHFQVRSNSVYVFRKGSLLFDERKGVGLSEHAPHFSTGVPVRVRCIPYTLCHLLQDIHSISVTVGLCSRLSWLIHPQLVTGLTVAKFMPLTCIPHVHGFSLSSCRYVWSYLITHWA
jgi:hypothetical protein